MTIPLILAYDLSWSLCATAFASNVSCVIVVNPNNGPGKKTDPDFKRWKALVNGIRACADDENKRRANKGLKKISVTIAGYIDCETESGGSKRSIAAEVKFYADNFDIEHIWLDDYHGDLATCRRLLGECPIKTTIINEGTKPSKITPRVFATCDYERESVDGLPDRMAPAKTIRIGFADRHSWRDVWNKAVATNVAAALVTDDRVYQVPPMWWRDWMLEVRSAQDAKKKGLDVKRPLKNSRTSATPLPPK